MNVEDTYERYKKQERDRIVSFMQDRLCGKYEEPTKRDEDIEEHLQGLINLWGWSKQQVDRLYSMAVERYHVEFKEYCRINDISVAQGDPYAAELRTEPPEATPDEEPLAPEIDSSDYSKLAEQKDSQWIFQSNIDLMEKRLKGVKGSDVVFDSMNRINVQNNQRAITWTEWAFIACQHRRAILTNDYKQENGYHVGFSPTRCANITTSNKTKGLKIGRLRREHFGEAFRALEVLRFAKKISDWSKGQCRSYAALPSDYWGFPEIKLPLSDTTRIGAMNVDSFIST